jgi:hypothetical protein
LYIDNCVHPAQWRLNLFVVSIISLLSLRDGGM